jgi:hypothetical protein
VSEFPERGIHEMSAEAYHADPAAGPSLSASVAHILCTSSPRHARTAHPKLNPDFERQQETHFDIGTVAHLFLLEGRDRAVERVEIICADDWRKKETQTARDAARAAGRTPLLERQYDEVIAMVSAAHDQLEVVNAQLDAIGAPCVFEDGKPEQTLVWAEDGNVACRARLDWLHDDLTCIDDYKTTGRSADPREWATRTIYSLGGDIQAAFYLRGLRAVAGAEAGFRFVVQETAPPYALAVVQVGVSVLALGRMKVEFALRTWRGCLERDEWPAYSARVATAETPAWAEERWLDREERDAA